MKAIVTGAGGFLGSHLLEGLTGHVGAIGLSTSIQQPAGNIFPFKTPGLSPDVVIHTHAAVASGAQTLGQATLYRGNVQATQEVVDRFPNARHLYFSTVSVYPLTHETISESTPPDPVTDYGKSKLQGEHVIAQASRHCIVRLSSLYGVRMKPHTLIPNYASQALEKSEISVWGDGSRRQNYIHVSDVVRLVKAIIAADSFNQNIFLGVDDGEYSNAEVARLVADLTDADVKFVNQDASLSVSYDGSFTRKAVNWRPETSLSQGLSEYIAWKKKQF